jgi:hypothetical protein
MAKIARPRQSVARLVPNAGNDSVIVGNHPPLGAGSHTYQYTNGAAPTQFPAAGNMTQATGSLILRFNKLTLEGTDVSAAMSQLKGGDTITIGTQTGTVLNAPFTNGDIWNVSMYSFPSLPDGVYQVSSSLGQAPGATAPVCAINPKVTGTVAQGAVLTSGTGTWRGTAPIAYTYQWTRNGIDIAGQTLATHTIIAADAGTTLACRVTATNGAGNASALSNKLGVPL